jgi:pimeloyl-ACP methyl ester carboxylesterase
MIRIITTMMLICLLIGCQKEKTNNNVVATAMDSTKVKAEIVTHIEGRQGAIFVDDGGTGGTPVLFAHSFAGNTTHWKEQLSLLRKTCRAVAFDFRNHGNSDSADVDAFSTDELAEDIEAVADSLHLDHFILVGHSQGGLASITYAAKHPDRVKGLVLVGTPGKTPLEQAKKVIESLKSQKYQEVMDQYMTRLLTNASPTTSAMLTQDVKKIDKERSINIIQSMFEYDPLQDLKKYQGPRLIIGTTAEEQQPNTLHKLAPEIPYNVIDGTSHWPMMDKPAEFNSMLIDFVSGIK